MDKEMKDKWVKALRFEGFKQCKRVLNNGSGYCCLGVLCEISNLGRWKEYYKKSHLYYIDDIEQSDTTIELPGAIVEKFGLNKSPKTSFLDRCGQPIYLSDLNDSGCTFDQIADVIEYDF